LIKHKLTETELYNFKYKWLVNAHVVNKFKVSLVLLKAALIQVRDYRLQGASGW
jgi:hypothetical protein